MDPNNSHMSNKSGPDILKREFEHDKAQVANPKGKAHLEVSYPSGLGENVHSDQSESVLGESSRLPMEAAVASVVSEAPIGVKLPILSNKPLPGQATELLASNSVVSHPNREGESFSKVDLRTTVEPRQPGHLEIVGSGSNPVMSTQEIMLLTGDDHLASHRHLHRPQWEASNHFFPLSNLDREGDPWSKEEVEDVFMETHPEVNYGSASQTGMMFSGVELVNGLQNGGSELLLLPWEQSGADSSVSGSGGQESGPLECVPLSWRDPKAVKDKVLTKVDEEGEQTKWVSTLMKSFCNMMGFPIVTQEAQCVALFHLPEQECLKVVNDGCV